MAGRIYPLFMLQDPRRNLYAPIYKARFLPKEKRLSSLFFHMALDIPLHIAFCGREQLFSHSVIIKHNFDIVVGTHFCFRMYVYKCAGAFRIAAFSLNDVQIPDDSARLLFAVSLSGF